MQRVRKLYDAQAQGVERFVASHDKRLILAYGTGCGKTPTAISALKAVLTNPDPRILVVCPAIVRLHWVHEFGVWAGWSAEPIEMGRHRTSGTKKALKARDAAYANPIQVTSYDLMGDVDPTGWDAIVFDEIHHLSDCTSKQSRMAQALMRANPGVPALGLSATLIPTDIWQLWHPMHLLFGSTWGKFPRAGKICWDFVGRYCDLIKNEYGTAVGAPKASRQSELRNRVLKVAHRLNREDIAKDLPPIDATLLRVPGLGLARNLHAVGKRTSGRPEVAHAVEWYRSLEADISHAVVLCYHRDVATALCESLKPHLKDTEIFRIDGSMPSAERVAVLANAEQAKSAVLVATSESIREGVRLMWAQKVLFAEWRQSPAQVVQVLGRFYSVGDSRRPQLQVLYDESLYGQAWTLMHRMGAVNKLLEGGNTERTVEEVFSPAEITDERLEELTRAMLSTHKLRDEAWTEESESEEDAW